MPLRAFRVALKSPFVIVFVALLIRTFLLWVSHSLEGRIGFHYVGLEALLVSHFLASGLGFSSPFPNYPYATAWLAPTYPWLISFGELVFGVKNHGIVIFAQVVSVIFSAATCYPIYGLGQKVYGRNVGLAAAWFWAFLPTAIIMPIAWIWDQSISGFLLCSLVLVTYSLRDSCSRIYWSGYGLLWAAAALTNPTICLLMPFMGGWLAFQRIRVGARPTLVLLTVSGLLFVLALLPWTIRNYSEFGELFFVKSNFGVELYLGNNPAVAEIHSRGHHPMDNESELRLLTLTNERIYDHLKQQEALAYIRNDPGLFFQHTYNRFIDTWTAKYDSRTDIFVQSFGLRPVYVACMTLFSLFAWAGLALALRENFTKSLPFAFCLLLFPIPYYITHSSIRYRHPIDPVMTILVVLTIVQLWRAIQGDGLEGTASTPGSPGTHFSDYGSVNQEPRRTVVQALPRAGRS